VERKGFKNHYEVWEYPTLRLEVNVFSLHKFRNKYVFQTTAIRHTFTINCNPHSLSSDFMRLLIFDFVIKWLILVLEVTSYLNTKRLCE